MATSALARYAEMQLLGALALKTGEDVMGDVLRVAMLEAIEDRRNRSRTSAVTQTWSQVSR